MCQNDDIINNSCNVDLVLDGINFTSGLLALAAQKSGLRVAIKLPTPLNFDFQPELSFYYPTGIKDIATSIYNFHFLLNCSSIFPYLFFPQRVLSFNTKGTINHQLNSLTDRLLRRERDWAALPFNTSKYKNYDELSATFSKGVLVYEYRFDRNWAVIELLKMCKETGSLIIPQSQSITGKVKLTCTQYELNTNFLTLKKFKWPYLNNVNIEQKSVRLTFQTANENTVVGIYPKTSHIEFNAFKDEIAATFTNLNLPVPQDFIARLQQIFHAHQSSGNETDNVCLDPNLQNLRSTFQRLLRNVSKNLGNPIKMDHLFEAFQNQKMNAEMFRIVQAECDEKFDLAKQTGIAYVDFVRLFYRHRNQIDEMIEEAYEMMDRTRNVKQIWQVVEEDWLKKVTNSLTG